MKQRTELDPKLILNKNESGKHCSAGSFSGFGVFLLLILVLQTQSITRLVHCLEIH